MDEVNPPLQVASGNAELNLPGGIAQSQTPPAELVVDRQLAHALRVHKRYPGEVDERWSSRSQTAAQDVLEDLVVSNVELPGELDQHGSVPAPVSPDRSGYPRIALYGAVPLGLRKGRNPLSCHPRTFAQEGEIGIGLLRQPARAIEARASAPRAS